MKKQIDWLYKPANVSADKYNGELMNLIHAVNPNFESTAGRQFYPVDHELFKKTCPDLMSLITKWGLQDRLSEVAIIWLNKGAKFGIHRDFPSWRARNLALNIPIINCDNSYTVWYDVELAKEKLGWKPETCPEKGVARYTKYLLDTKKYLLDTKK